METCPEDITFTNILRNKFVRGAPASLKNSISTLPYSSDVTVGTVATELGKLKTVKVIGSRGGRGHLAAFHHQRQGGCGYHNGQQSQSSNENSLTHEDLWHWLVNHGVPRSDIERKPIKFLLDVYKQKSSRSSVLES